MKIRLRTACFLLAALLLCVLFTGCTALDEARAAHGKWDENDNIVLNGETYLLLPKCEYLSPVYSSQIIYVTENDVPVLLKEFLGSYMFLSDDGIFLESDDALCYCRSDHYDEVVQHIRNGFTPTGYYYSYFDFDEETYAYSEKYYRLTATQVSALNAVLDTVAPVSQPPVVNLEYDYIAEMMAYDRELYFCQYACDVLSNDGRYYVVEYTETNTLLYEVPLEHYGAFHALMEKPRTGYEEGLSYRQDSEWDAEQSL